MKNNQWSRKFTDCIICHKTDSPHQSRGACLRCWIKEKYKNNEAYRKHKKEWLTAWKKENPERAKEIAIKAKKKYEQNHHSFILEIQKAASKRYYIKNKEKILARKRERLKLKKLNSLKEDYVGDNHINNVSNPNGKHSSS